MNARLQHRAASSHVSSAAPKKRLQKPSEFEHLRRTLDGYLSKALDARKRLLEEPYDPKLLHAWRTNLRRVTATVKDVAALSDDDLHDVLAYLRLCREATGQCRDVDILANETLPTFLDKDQGKLTGGGDVRKVLSDVQQQNHKNAVVQLKKHSLSTPLQAWRHWVETLEPPSDGHVRKLAAAAIEKRFDDLKKRADKLDGGQKRLHRLRSAAKKMRYSIELYEHAFPKQAIHAWQKGLADLQGHLGDAHDRMMGSKLIGDVVTGEGAKQRLKPFRDWSKRSAFKASEKAMDSLKKLKKLKPYWRPEAH
jgi:CHAD domain-containing protein